MKKLLAVALSLILVLGMASVALAADVTDTRCGDIPPYTSSQEVSVTINGFKDPGETGGLPSKYCVRVIWRVQDGVYDVSQAIKSGKELYKWNCRELEYITGADFASEDANKANWTTVPMVGFEVTNASTPDNVITATPSLEGTDNWAQYMKSESITAQNTTIGTQTVNPVSKEKLGSGEVGRVDGDGPFSKQEVNVYQYTYTLNWDYAKLNAKAYDLWLNGGTASETATNKYVVTIGLK